MTFHDFSSGAGGYPFTSVGGQDGSVRSASVVAAFCPSSMHVSAIVEKVSSVNHFHTHTFHTQARAHAHTHTNTQTRKHTHKGLVTAQKKRRGPGGGERQQQGRQDRGGGGGRRALRSDGVSSDCSARRGRERRRTLAARTRVYIYILYICIIWMYE